MNFILVPFLLAVRLKSDDYKWRYGPEYTFNASVATVYVGHRHVEWRMFTLMKCRPEEPDSLRCRFENGAFAKSYDPPSEDNQDVFHPRLDFGNEVFEMKFTEDGIEKYAFQENDGPVNETVANLYRLIANELSVWSKVRTAKQRTRLENTVVGKCLVDYEVSYGKADNQTMGREYQLVWLINEPIGQEVRVTRKVQLESCIPHPAYVLGSKIENGASLKRFGEKMGPFVNEKRISDHNFESNSTNRAERNDASMKDLIEKMGRFTSETRISKHSFESNSTNRVDVYDLNGRLSETWFDLVHLSLTSVDPARCADMTSSDCRG